MEEQEEEEVTAANSPFDLHLKQMGIDSNKLDQATTPIPPPKPRRKIGSGDIVWRDGAFLDDAETPSAPISWWRRLFRWAPTPLGAVIRNVEKMRRVWWGPTSTVDWLQICVKFFGFSEQLKTYMRLGVHVLPPLSFLSSCLSIHLCFSLSLQPCVCISFLSCLFFLLLLTSGLTSSLLSSFPLFNLS